MSVDEIEEAISKLSTDDLAAFRVWFAEFGAAQWDRQIEDDIAAGKLDVLADESLGEHLNGQTTDL